MLGIIFLFYLYFKKYLIYTLLQIFFPPIIYYLFINVWIYWILQI